MRDDVIKLGISIHAFRVEGDLQHFTNLKKKYDFNPRLPCGRRHQRRIAMKKYIIISIHAFRVEGDKVRVLPQCTPLRNFNPRLPCGRRPHLCQMARNTYGDFNPRLPCGRRLYFQLLLLLNHKYFNPRLPCGRRPAEGRPMIWCHKFQSTPSVWKATTCPRWRGTSMVISIHAFRVEGDDIHNEKLPESEQFQSTPSVWKAT